jgi:hypothetical protein
LFCSSDQSRPNNADLFLLILNNTSRPLRKEFESQKTNSSNVMAHIFQTRMNNRDNSLPTSTRTSLDSTQHPTAVRVNNQFSTNCIFYYINRLILVQIFHHRNSHRRMKKVK